MPDRQLSPLLELDPDLGVLLDEDRRAAAQLELGVAVHALAPGEWDVARLSGASPEHPGLLMLNGVLAREVLVSDTVSTELLGPGDVIRPWRLHQSASLLRHSVRWSVLAPSRIALLDRRLGAQLGRYPEINAALLDRVTERAVRLAVTQAISQLNRVDRRLLALFWHLAERWGRMTASGVAVPMTLSHRMLGQLVGARRPTVSTALAQLAKEGQLSRREDGTWLLCGAPVGMPSEEVARIVPMRRRLLPPEADTPSAREPATVAALLPRTTASETEPVHVTGVEMRAVLQRLRERCDSQARELRTAYEITTELTRRTVELRDRCRETRDGLRITRAAAPPERPARTG